MPSTTAVSAPKSTLTGVVERITFHSEESGYTVAKLNTGNVKKLITIVVSFANVQAGQPSIHKSQGSEYPVVILPLYTQHYMMLSRNLFYTGLTRVKKLALIVGSEKAITIAVNQVKQQQRYTRLKEKIFSKIKVKY